MSTHPNVILKLALTPEDLARKTYRAIRVEAGAVNDDADITVGSENYHTVVMESDYDEGWQLSAKEGDILVFDLVTYGYGEEIAWDKLAAQKAELEQWAMGICERYHCTFSISVTANYW